jgi:hypothetical protein
MTDIQRSLQAVVWSDIVTVAVLALIVIRAAQAIRGYLYVRDVYAGRSENVSEMGRLVQRNRIIAWCRPSPARSARSPSSWSSG